MRAFSGRPRRLAWLGLTPDPERLLPGEVARLRHALHPATPEADLESAERRRVERLILHGTQRRWIRYLGELTDLVAAVAAGAAPGDPRTAREVADVVRHHHRMLIGLPGPGYQRTRDQRAALDAALTRLESLRS